MNSSNNTVARKKNAVFQRHIVPRKKKRMKCFFFLGTKHVKNLLYNSRQQDQASCNSTMHPAAAMTRRLELQALHNTHREAMRLCLMEASQGATDAQIAHALRQGLPHLTDPGSLQDQSFGKQPQGIGIHSEDRQTQGFLLAADAALPACLPVIPTSRIAAAGH